MNVKEELMKKLAESGDEFVSGAALAEKLGVSRNAVWKAVKAAREEGFELESSPKGYKLAKKNNHLSADVIRSALGDAAGDRTITVLDETDSTNIAAKELAAAGAVHGSVVVADKQSAGRGRLSRGFVSPPGKGLYMTVIVRPQLDMKSVPMITSAAAVGAALAVEELCGSEVQIKWVNDLYMNEKKICGILTEASLDLEMKSLDYAVIGIGINVRSVKEDFDEDLRLRATSVEDEAGVILDRNELCAKVLKNIDIWLDKIADRSYIIEYRRREFLTGKRITAEVDGKTITGTAVGIDRNANLMVELPDGDIINLNSGEATLHRR